MFEHSFRSLPNTLYKNAEISSFPSATQVAWNQALASELGIQKPSLEDQLSYGAGQPIPNGAIPTALAYAGHQFGHFVHTLGDGRAVLLGEIINSHQQRMDLQLKGTGQTFFSRRGDGFSALGPVIREYLVSEAMHALGIPTTRALSAFRSGQMVRRQHAEPGGILARVANSHIRIGTFEYLNARDDVSTLHKLVQYCIDRHDPQANQSDNPTLTFYKNTCERFCRLITQWMRVGFIHGVMNTDNMAISGQTIDYGPCAFMDDFQADKTFSSIDQQGRYAYNQQPAILFWNLAVLANCLVPVVDPSKQKATEMLQNILEQTQSYFQQNWREVMGQKLGLQKATQEDDLLLETCFEWLEKEKLDFTQTFHLLTTDVNARTTLKPSTAAQSFFQLWDKRLAQQNLEPGLVHAIMAKVNPVCIPRNHLIEQTIQESYEGNDELFHQLHHAWKTPYSIKDKQAKWLQPPQPHEVVLRTFCGT